MKSFSNDIILNYIDEIPQETRDDFLLEFCRAIQKRKDELISMNGFDPFPDSYDTKTPKGIDPIRYMIAQKILWTPLQENTHIEPDSTEAALQRVEELKQKYTPEEIVQMKRLRAEVEEMLLEVGKVNILNNESVIGVLTKYGVRQYHGYKTDGAAIDFILSEISGYKAWIENGVIFKAEIRKIDQKLITRINYEAHHDIGKDPLLTEDKYTELVAAGIFGDKKQQQIATALLYTRSANRERVAAIRN